MDPFITLRLVRELAATLERDPSFALRTPRLAGDIELSEGEHTFTLRIHSSDSIEAFDGSAEEPILGIRGTSENWRLALAEAPDITSMQKTRFGGLLLEGDAVRLAGIASGLKILWSTLRGLSGTPETIHPRASHGTLVETDPRLEIVGRYVEVSGFRVYYESAGEGKPIICLHSAGADGREYRHALPHLAGLGYRAISVDLPGHGKSYPRLSDLGMIESGEDFLRFLLDFSKALGLEKPAYIGVAMTGSLLLRLAIDYPEDVGAVVAANANTDFTSGLDPVFLEILTHPQVSIADFMQAMTDGLVGRELPDEAYHEVHWQNARNMTPEVMKAAIGIYGQHDIRLDLDRLTTPVLHIYGEFDGDVAESGIDELRALENVVSRRLPGVGHLPMIEAPRLFNQTVESFLAQVYAATAHPSAHPQ